MDMVERDQKIDELCTVLCSLWSGGGGDYGVYTVANERTRLKALLHELLGPTDAALSNTREGDNG